MTQPEELLIFFPGSHQLFTQLNLIPDPINFSLIVIAGEFWCDLGEDIATFDDVALSVVDVNNLPGLVCAYCLCRTLNERAVDKSSLRQREDEEEDAGHQCDQNCPGKPLLSLELILRRPARISSSVIRPQSARTKLGLGHGNKILKTAILERGGSSSSDPALCVR